MKVYIIIWSDGWTSYVYKVMSNKEEAKKFAKQSILYGIEEWEIDGPDFSDRELDSMNVELNE
jgi:hypothetical protein